MTSSISFLGRCLLFVPASQPDRFAKAVVSGADVVCLDLEDSVLPDDKIVAREHALRYLCGPRPERPVARALRINALSRREGIVDLLAFANAKCIPDLLLLPKVRDAAELRIVRDIWGESAPPLVCLIETSAGILNSREIAAGARGGILYGEADLSAELGVSSNSDSLTPVRVGLVLAAKAAQVDIMDSPSLRVRDLDELAVEARRAKAWGFTGKAAIHPDQVPVIRAAFTPTAEEIDRAERALAAFSAAGQGATVFEGRLLEKPMIDMFERTLRQAEWPGRISE